MAKPLEYDPALRVDESQTVRQELPFALRVVGLGIVLAGLATAIFATLQTV
ncbi:hypothetical protein [Microvirga pudoricolor]|uniref:hypothetical protein n=1 Tax=Microvirga pudoricolor TaxID=2778729 RepID=UPI00194F7663|nr:hypothetical protein [Microvirga pudoricolor]MBM6593734.1 hypothetical protein [Microvirga pudoricolor]